MTLLPFLQGLQHVFVPPGLTNLLHCRLRGVLLFQTLGFVGKQKLDDMTMDTWNEPPEER